MTADEFEQGIVAQGGGVVLIFIATGDLVDPLADEGGEGMGTGFAPPVGDAGGDLGTNADLGIGSGEPGQATIGGEVATVEGGFEGEGGEGVKGEGGMWENRP